MHIMLFTFISLPGKMEVPNLCLQKAPAYTININHSTALYYIQV